MRMLYPFNLRSLTRMAALAPEKVGTYDFSLAYQGNVFQTQVSYFLSRMSDNIVLNLVGDLYSGVYQYQNLGSFKIRGIETETKYYVTRNVFLTGSTLWQHNEDGDHNHDVTPIANFGAKAGVWNARLLPNAGKRTSSKSLYLASR